MLTLNWKFTYFFEAKTIYVNSFVVKMMYAHFICRKNDVCTLFLSQKWFMHTFFVAKMIYGHFFCWKNNLRTRYMRFFVGKTIYALHLESFCAFIFAIRKVHTFWDSAPQNPDKLADLSRPTWSCFSSTWLVLSQKLDLAIGLLAYWSKVCLMSSILKT